MDSFLPTSAIVLSCFAKFQILFFDFFDSLLTWSQFESHFNLRLIGEIRLIFRHFLPTPIQLKLLD